MREAPAGAQLQALLDFAAARRAHYPTFLLVQRESSPHANEVARAAPAARPPLERSTVVRNTSNDSAIDRKTSTVSVIEDYTVNYGEFARKSADDDAIDRNTAGHEAADRAAADRAVDLLEALAPNLVTEALTDRWPGSSAKEDRARVFFYRLDHASALALAKVDSLAAFAKPLPEDLCILANDKTPWLVTSARDNRYQLHLTPDEERAIQKGLPWLRLEPETDPPGLGRET